MPLKMQYPLRLHKDTKCPACNTQITSIDSNVYVCQGQGHIMEGILLVTLKPKPQQQPASGVTGSTTTTLDKVLTPSYDKDRDERNRGTDDLQEDIPPMPGWRKQ